MPITINGTSGITGPDGSTTTPAIVGTDSDTGFVFAAGQITASLNGTPGNVPLVSGTAQNSTSGTSIDFTGIPSWVKRVTVMFNGVSTNGSSSVLLQLGAGSVTTTGYNSSSSVNATGVAAVNNTTGFIQYYSGNDSATASRHGSIFLSLIGSNTWVASGVVGLSNAACTTMIGGLIALSGTLDRVRITTVNGTDTFDAGSINILYE